MVKGISYKTINVMMVALLIFAAFLGTSVSAAEDQGGQGTAEDVHTKISPEQLQAISVQPSTGTSSINDVDFEAVIPTEEGSIPVQIPVSTRSAFEVSGTVMDFNDSLIATDLDDLWFFSADSDRSMLLQLVTSNLNYRAQLYLVDWTTGQATPTNISTNANSRISLNNLPAGDYLIRVYSTGTVGEGYSLGMNATNPSNPSTFVVDQSSISLKYVQALYPNGDIFSNGQYVANSQGNNTTLDWERKFYFSWGSGYNSRTHSIFNVKVKSVSRPVSYVSSYASSNNAVLIYLDNGTSFMHHAAYYQSGPNHVYESSFDDISGRLTPRYLDQQDFDNWGNHAIVYDLNTNKVIDFYSVLNFYYGTNVEAEPTVNFLN